MCGRFAMTQPDKLMERFGLDTSSLPFVQEQDARYNIAPTQEMLVIASREGKSRALPMRWGLVPSWSKEDTAGAKMINARAETVAEKPAFRAPFKRHRVLVPASGFYEWKRDGDSKTPYYIHLKDEPLFAFAGLYDTWTPPDGGEMLSTFTIITTAPNALMEDIHNRMPVILPRESESLWLDPDIQDADTLTALLTAYPAEAMAAWAVSKSVNSPTHNTPSLLEPVE